MPNMLRCAGLSMFSVLTAARPDCAEHAWKHYPDLAKLWSEYKYCFGRSYSEADDAIRFAQFQKNVDTIQSVNSGNNSYTLGLTDLSDALPEEMQARTGGSTNGMLPHEDGTYLGRHVWNGETLPDSVDWTTQGAVTPAKDQKICGSCWAFSAVASLEGANFVTNGKLVSLSEQQAMQCGSPTARGCEGGWPDNVFKYAVDNELCTEESYPYQGVDTIPCFWNDPTHSTCSVAIPKGGVAGYKDVTVGSLEDMMSAVAAQPVSVAVGGSGHWSQYSGGVFTDCDVGVGHAVTVVGYGTHPSDGKYWKLKNSWGTSFGIDGGYILIGRDRGVAEGECGILQHASYPVMASDAVQV